MIALKNMGLVGDRILVRPETREEQKTESGIILPTSVVDDNDISSGIVVMIGPGMVSGSNNKRSEDWMEESSNKVEFIPLQIKIGYRVLFIPDCAYEVQVDGKTYMIMQQGAVIMYDKDPFGLSIK